MGDFPGDAGQFIHPLVTLMDGVRMIGCLPQPAIQLWIIINRPVEGLAGFTLPLKYRGANPVGVQIQSQYPAGMGLPLQWLHFFIPRNRDVGRGQGNREWNVPVPGASELQFIQKLPVLGLLTQFYLEWQSHFGPRVKPNGTVLDVQHEAMVASLFTMALGVSLKVQRQQPFGFPLLGRDPSLGTQLQMMPASKNNGSPWTGTRSE